MHLAYRLWKCSYVKGLMELFIRSDICCQTALFIYYDRQKLQLLHLWTTGYCDSLTTWVILAQFGTHHVENTAHSWFCLFFFQSHVIFFFLEFILLNWLCIIHLIPCDYLNFYYILWQKPLQSLKTFLSFIYIQTTSSNFLLMQVFSFIALKNVWCALDNTVIIMCRMCGE